MRFTSPDFLVFLAIAAAVYGLSPRWLRAPFILGASYLFYLAWDPAMAGLLLLLTGIAYWSGLRLEPDSPQTARFWLGAGLFVLLGCLLFFKVATVVQSGRHLAIPLGISYYTFKLISYLLDVYWQKSPPEKSFVRLAAFAAFFPQIVAGPIQRCESFSPQLAGARRPDRNAILSGIARIMIGFMKKLLAADNLALLVGSIFARSDSTGGLTSLLGIYLFPLQLYADFSGLTDIAIGSALLFGIESPENFDAPFAGKNISDFWRRWHMSLTYWLRDYVFTPLRMATRNWGNIGLVVSITVNMVLIGLWHRLSAAFLVFGLLHSLFLVIDALTLQRRKRYYKIHPRAAFVMDLAGPVLTYQLVAVASIFCRADSVVQGFELLAGVFRSGAPATLAATVFSTANRMAWIGLPALALAEILDRLTRRLFARDVASLDRPVRWSLYATASVTAVFLLMVLLTHSLAVSPFFYAMF
jgi:alginate O-acetyltransferase complex protein AlgI